MCTYFVSENYDKVEGFHVTSYQENFAGRHTRNRHVGFLFARDGIGKHNKMLRYFLFSSYHITKLLSNKNISAHTRLKFQIFLWSKLKVQAVWFSFLCLFVCFLSKLSCTKGKEMHVCCKIVRIWVRTAVCKPSIMHLHFNFDACPVQSPFGFVHLTYHDLSESALSFIELRVRGQNWMPFAHRL